MTDLRTFRQARRRWYIATLSTALALPLAGCGGMVMGNTESAQVRFVDLSINAPTMDLYLNGGGVAYGLNFGTVTSYIPVPSGEVKIQVTRGSSAQMLAGTVGLLNGSRTYTVVASNVLGNLQEMVYPDAGGPAPNREIAFRVLNEDVDAGPVDVYLLPSTSALAGGFTPAVRGTAYKDASAYLSVPAGPAYAVAVVPTGAAPTASAVLHGVSVSGGAGAVRTLVLSGSAERGEKGLAGFVLNDFDVL